MSFEFVKGVCEWPQSTMHFHKSISMIIAQCSESIMLPGLLMVENSQPCLPFYFLKESKVSWPEGTLTNNVQDVPVMLEVPFH